MYPTNVSQYLRVRFSTEDEYVTAVKCSDFFADKIAAEQEQSKNEYANMFYSNTFADSDWICPDITSIELQRYDVFFTMDVVPCSFSKELDEGQETMTTYVANQDEECIGFSSDQLPYFTVKTMLVSDTFNPYIYHKTGQVQSTTRFSGEYSINKNGRYEDKVNLKSDSRLVDYFYVN